MSFESYNSLINLSPEEIKETKFIKKVYFIEI